MNIDWIFDVKELSFWVGKYYCGHMQKKKYLLEIYTEVCMDDII